VAERGRSGCFTFSAPGSRSSEGDAVSENAKFSPRHPTAFERVAVVSDEVWLAPAIKALSLLLPARRRRFPVRELTSAK